MYKRKWGAVGSIVSNAVTKRFGSKSVLRGFSFEAKPSEITFLAGRNGVGKTTWIHIATGIMQSNSGSISFGGKPVGQIRDKLAIVFDEPPIYPNINGLMNLKAISGIRKLDTDWVKRVLRNLQIDSAFLRKRARHYSLGQRHRLAVAAALLRHPLYLFLDEPAVGLDIFSWELVRDSLRQLANEGATIILTGQDFEAIKQLVDRVVILKDGVAEFSGTVPELLERFPPSVYVRSPNPKAIIKLFQQAKILDLDEGLLEINCESMIEAEQMALSLKKLEEPLYEIRIRNITLEEAFYKIVCNTLDSKDEGAYYEYN